MLSEKEILDKCVSQEQRDELKSLLEYCDRFHISPEIGKEIDMIEELNEFCDSVSDDEKNEEFRKTFEEFFRVNKPKVTFDLVFPSFINTDGRYSSWVINIGREIDDADSLGKEHFWTEEKYNDDQPVFDGIIYFQKIS